MTGVVNIGQLHHTGKHCTKRPYLNKWSFQWKMLGCKKKGQVGIFCIVFHAVLKNIYKIEVEMQKEDFFSQNPIQAKLCKLLSFYDNKLKQKLSLSDYICDSYGLKAQLTVKMEYGAV